MLLITILLVVILYARTIRYNHLIDDFVLIEGYYTVGVIQPPWEFFDTKPSLKCRLWMITLHCINTTIIYLLWGAPPALVFAIHPMAVWGTAWKTGSYYATATFFTLVSYYVIHTFPNIYGMLIAMPLFNAAINCTVCPVSFPLLSILNPWLTCLFIPLAMLFNSKRFKKGMAVRNNFYYNKTNYELKRLVLMVKVVARYTFEAILPLKTAMFIDFARETRDDNESYDRWHKIDKLFWLSLALVVSVFALGLMVNVFAICWFFVCIGLHSQWNMTGQSYAQRYLYLPLVGMAVVIAGALTRLHPYALPMYAMFLLIRTNESIPAFKNMVEFLKNDIRLYPDYFYTYNNLAIHLMSTEGYTDEIEHILLEAERRNPNSWETQLNLSKFFMHTGYIQQALNHVNKGMKMKILDREVPKIFEERKAVLEEILEKLNNTKE